MRLGAVAYELLTGRPVFMGTTPQMILSAHVADTPDPVSKHRDTVPTSLEQVVMRCLEKKPADRWQKAEDLLPLLEALATPSGGMTPTDTRPIPASVRATQWSRWIPGAVGVAAILVALFVIFSIWAPRSTVDQPGPVVPIQLTANPMELSITGSAISPHGDYLAFIDPRGVHLQTLSTNDIHTVPIGSEVVPWRVWWYPDGTRLLLLGSDSTEVQSLWSVSMFGGTPRRVPPAFGMPQWLPMGDGSP